MKIYRISQNCLEISPHLFTFEKHALRQGYSDTDVFQLNGRLQPNVTLIGYCDANKLEIRPRDGYAIMVEIDGDEIWIHCGNELPCRT